MVGRKGEHQEHDPAGPHVVNRLLIVDVDVDAAAAACDAFSVARNVRISAHLISMHFYPPASAFALRSERIWRWAVDGEGPAGSRGARSETTSILPFRPEECGTHQVKERAHT